MTFDIKDLFVNIPIKETLTITKTLLSQYSNEQITKQIITIPEIILQQNYFSFQDNIYQPAKGISMGSPISNTIAEIFLQNLGNIHLKQLLDTETIVLYTRYISSILIIYNTKHTHPETIHNHMNKIHPKLQFTPTHKHNNSISFLDLLIIQNPPKIEIDIFRKLTTTTDTTINFTSNHSTEHKIAAYRFLINRMMSLPLTVERRHVEWQKIITVARNKSFLLHLIAKLKTHIQHKTHMTKDDNNKKWATFTYYSPKIRKITNLFKQPNKNIAFKSTNTI